MVLEGGASFAKGGAGHILALRHSPRRLMQNAAYIKNGVGGISAFVKCSNRGRELQ